MLPYQTSIIPSYSLLFEVKIISDFYFQADFQPEMYPTVEKQSLSLAPDLMQHRPPRYEHPQTDTRAEHHYDVPHLTNR